MQTEVPPKLLEEWLDLWCARYHYPGKLQVTLRPHTAGSDVLELAIVDQAGKKLADVVFASMQDRRGRNIISVRDQNTFDTALRRKHLMTLMHRPSGG